MENYTHSDGCNSKFLKMEEICKMLNNMLSSKKASQTPVIIDCKKSNELFLFFFNNGHLKASCILNRSDNIWYQADYGSDIVAVCMFDGDIYAKDVNNNLLKLCQKKQEV